jgi:RNA polymerase sigma-70 factor (ECF subfamily)
MTPTDLALLQALAQGQEQAFSQLYALYAELVYNTALHYLGQKEDAEEVCQDVFLQLYQSADQFRGEASLKTWIYRICINKSLSLIRKRQAKRSLWSRLLSSDKIPEQGHEDQNLALEQAETHQQLFKAIQQLNEAQRTAFILAYWEELPQREIAQIMNLNLKAVESLLSRAKEKLKKQFPREGK